MLVDALRDLSDQTEPLHWDALESFVRDSLGERFIELEIDPEAIAAASLAQVHLAKVRATGEWICLKMQYPGWRRLSMRISMRWCACCCWRAGSRPAANWTTGWNPCVTTCTTRSITSARPT